MSTTPARQDDQPDEAIGLVDGPTVGRHFLGIAARSLLVTGPIILAIAGLGAIGVLAGERVKDVLPPVAFFAACVTALGLLVALIGPNVAAQARRRRDVVLAQRTGVLGAGARLCWTAVLVSSNGRFAGSLHAAGGLLRFLWHAPPNLQNPAVDVRQETLVEAPLSAITAVETAPTSFGEWLWLGATIVEVHLHDGRRLRLGAHAPVRLAAAIRRLLERPEGTPAGLPLDSNAIDRTSLDEIGRSLTRRFGLVALIVKEPGEAKGEPFVVLHGPALELRGALENAGDALARDRDALAPYLKARATAEGGRTGAPPPT